MPVDSPLKKPSYTQKLKQQFASNDFDIPNQRTPTITSPKKSNIIDFLQQEVQNQKTAPPSTFSASPLPPTSSTKKSNIIDFAAEKAKRTKASSASPLTSVQATDSFFALENLNPQTAVALASVANGLQKEQVLNLLNGPLKNVLLTAAKIPSYDSRAIEKFSQQLEQEYEQFYQQLANEYKPSLADAKFKEQARQVVLSDQEISRLGEEISQTTRDLIDSSQPQTFIQNYFQKKSGAFPSSSQTNASSIKEETSQQKKVQGELTAEKKEEKQTETEEELPSVNSSTSSAEDSSSSRSRSQEFISSGPTTSNSTSSATSQSSSSQVSTASVPMRTSSPPAEESVSTEKKTSRLQQIRQTVKQQAESPQETSSSKKTVISPESAATVTGTIAATSSPFSADISTPSTTNVSKTSTAGYSLKPKPTVSSPTSSPPAEESVSTEKKTSRLQQIRQTVKQQAESPQETSSSKKTVISPESAATVTGTIAATSSPFSADIPTPSAQVSSTSASTQTPSSISNSGNVGSQAPFSSQQRSPFIRRKALTSKTKSKLSPQNYLKNKAKNVTKKFIQKVLQVLGQFFASILPYIWPVLLGLGVLVAGAALATGGVATVVGGGTAVFTAVTAWISSTFGPFDNATVQLANQSPLVDKTCAQCLTITKTVALKGGLDKTGEAIDANNAKRAYFTYTIIPNTKECSNIQLNGACSDLISIACKNINSNSCPGLDPVNYQTPEPLTDIVTNSAATKAVPTNYALAPNAASGVSENGNLDVPACNALLRALKTDNLHNYPLTDSVTFNLEEFLPNGYPLPYGDDYRLDNTFTLGYSGQPINQNGSIPSENTATGTLEIHMINVLWGDAILIRTQNQVIVIDGGSKGDNRGGKLIKYMKNLGITTIDTYILTHDHEDHAGNTETLFQNFTVKSRYSPVLKTSANPDPVIHYPSFIPNNQPLKDGDSLTLSDGVSLKILGPPTDVISRNCSSGKRVCGNNDSLVFMLTFGNNKFLFTGDSGALDRIATNHASEIKADFLKYPHHGSDVIVSPSTIYSIQPKVVFTWAMSQKKQEPILAGGGSIYFNQSAGNLVLTSDGNQINVKTSW